MRLLLAPALAALAASSSFAACSDDQPRPGDPDAAADEDPDASPPVSEFVSFRRVFGGGPCPDDVDCSGFIELRADRTLLFDREGELPVVVHEASVTPAELASAIDPLTARALIRLLDLDEPPCEPPTDIFDSMTLVLDSGEHSNSVTLCDDRPIVAARAALGDLAQVYFP